MSTLGDRLVWRDGDMRLSQCALCRHRRPGSDRRGRPMCAAFPEGIPSALLVNAFDHRLAHPDDRGMRLLPVVDASTFARITRLPMRPSESERDA